MSNFCPMFFSRLTTNFALLTLLSTQALAVELIMITSNGKPMKIAMDKKHLLNLKVKVGTLCFKRKMGRLVCDNVSLCSY